MPNTESIMRNLMKRFHIPHTDQEVSSLCYGASSFGTDVVGNATDRLVTDFVEAGGNFFDTAHCYACWVPNGAGASERELGAVLRRTGLMDKVIIATKGGHPDFDAHYRRPADFLSEHVLQSDITESLERLGVDTIPLYYLHRDDGVTPVDAVIEFLNAQVNMARINYFAASNWSVERIAEANTYAEKKGLQGFVMSQVQWSLAIPNWTPTETEPTTRYVTDKEIVWHSESGVPIACYSATASGFFAGNPKAKGLYENPTSRERYERAVALAEERSCTPTQISLAYLMHQSVPTIPLFSTTRPEHLAEILGATDLILTPQQVDWLRDGNEN